MTADGPRILTPWHLSERARAEEPVAQGAVGES